MRFWKGNERKILTVVAIATEVVAVVAAYREAPKFKKLAEEIKAKKEAGEEIDKLDVAKKAAPSVLKVAVPLAVSITAQVVNYVKVTEIIRDLTSLCMLAKEGRDAYKLQVAKDHGQEEADRIEDEVIKQKVTREFIDQTPNNMPMVYETGHGNEVFYDEYTDSYIKTSANYIEKVINDLNNKIIEEHDCNGCVLLSEYARDMGIPRQRVKQGDDYVWSYGNTGVIRYRLTSGFTEDNKLFGTIHLIVEPECIKWH